jgi:hypothetical protein
MQAFRPEINVKFKQHVRAINVKMKKRKKARERPQKTLDSSAQKGLLKSKKKLTRGRATEETGGQDFVAQKVQTSEVRKRGRRTIGDNFLLGARNGLLSFFEQVWHEIGWQLLQIRRQGTGTMDDVRNVFEAVRSKPAYRDKPDHHWADCFLRGLPQAATDKERRANRIKAAALHSQIQKMRSQQQELEYTSAYAETAVQQAGENEKEIIQSDANQKKARLEELKENLRRTEAESNELDKMMRERETYFYCSQLLDFLCKGKYAVKPLPLANSLAGLVDMGWRQSLARCSKMPRSSFHVHYPYGVLEAISRIWKRRTKNPELSMTDLFHAEIPKLRKQDREARTYLAEGWRDLRMAIAECSSAKHNDDFMPYAITQAFVNNRSRSKTQAEQILDEHDKLPS